ncbi:MAG: CDP-alcohol phosphatidyltransferase family protein [Bacteroidota bacterium]
MGYKEIGRQILYGVFDPAVHGLHRLGVTPNVITILGLILNVAAALHLTNYLHFESLQYGECLFGFGIWLGFAGLMDTMDGRLARLYDLKSVFGAFFDSVVDRYSEFIMFLGMILYFFAFDNLIGAVLCFVACMSSIMVSYTRSRAESLGVDCSVGLMQRPERIVFIGVWSIIWGLSYLSQGSDVLQPLMFGIDGYVGGLVVFTWMTTVSAIRRLLYTRRTLLSRSH